MRRLLVLLLLALPAAAAAQGPIFIVRAVDEHNKRALANTLIQVREVESDVVFAEARTNDQGQVSIPVAPLQWYSVQAIAPGFTSREQVLLSLARGTSSFAVLLEPVAAKFPRLKYGTVSGRVLGTGGVPLPGIVVTADGGPTAMQWGRTTTEKDGSFRMEVPEGTYKVGTASSSPSPLFVAVPPVFDVYGAAEMSPVTVAADRETSGVVIYPPREQRFRARVTVVADTGPVSDGRVEWRGAHGRGFAARIQPGGFADLGPLARGVYTITAIAGRKPAQLAGTGTIEVDDEPLDDPVIYVVPAGRASGHVLGVDGRPVRLRAGEHFSVLANAAGSLSLGSGPDNLVDRDGRFLLTGLLGDICLSLAGEDAHAASVTHEGTDYTGRPFHFEPGREISGIVIRLGRGRLRYPDDRRCPR
jgi:hypothetical protein